MGQIVGFVQSVRKEDLEKKPGVARNARLRRPRWRGSGVNDITSDPAALQASLVTLLKTRRDRDAPADRSRAAPRRSGRMTAITRFPPHGHPARARAWRASSPICAMAACASAPPRPQPRWKHSRRLRRRIRRRRGWR